MATIYFRAGHNYASGQHRGRMLGPWLAGQVIGVDSADLTWLAKDSPGLFDLQQTLSDDEARRLRAEHAEAERAEAVVNALRLAAVAAYRREHSGDWCRLGLPHTVPHIAPLSAEQDGDGWRVGCAECLTPPKGMPSR
jgi:hypothetical protein